MAQKIRIQMMSSFAVYLDEIRMETQIGKSRKGVSLLEMLILARGDPVDNRKLYESLWGDEQTGNPEAALKTLISRLRASMNQLQDGFGGCIVANRGSYRWESLPGVTVDVLEIMEIFDRLNAKPDEEERTRLTQQLLSLYTGDLLQYNASEEWLAVQETDLHNRYMEAIYAHLSRLREAGEDEEICRVCRIALEVDRFDERLHMDLMDALVRTNRASDAMAQYEHAMRLSTRYLGIQPSEALRDYYSRIAKTSRLLEGDMKQIREELEKANRSGGATVCEYGAFREIYGMLMRNLKRLSVSVFLGVITISDVGEGRTDSIRQDNRMNTLIEIMRTSLRSGDTITRYSPNVAALLLPTVNYETGRMVVERIRSRFFSRYPRSDIRFEYRISPLSADAGQGESPPKEM
ncbi:MAG: winged helix-turn-helix domain-containing protein [Clostridiales bacterium]|nr:winged helix-turn-helix domain-containing protein [Clostridiales bacterium]